MDVILGRLLGQASRGFYRGLEKLPEFRSRETRQTVEGGHAGCLTASRGPPLRKLAALPIFPTVPTGSP